MLSFQVNEFLVLNSRKEGELVVEIKRKENESTEALLRRFKRKIQQSGVLLQARKIKYFEPRKNKRAVRVEAIRKTGIRKERELLRKLGKMPIRKHW